MYILVACLAVFLTYLIVKKYEHNKKYKDIERIPGPPSVWLFGSMFSFGKTTAEAFQSQLRLAREYGSFIRIWMGPQLVILVSDPIKLEYFLSSNEHINKSVNYDGFKAWLGNGLIHSRDNHWRKHRKIITPAFHFKILEQFTSYINSNSKILIARLKQQLDQKSVDIHPYINSYNLDVISETAMRTKINAQVNENREYVKALRGFMDIHMLRIFSLFKRIDFIFQLTSDYKRQQEYTKILKSFTENVIMKRKEERRRLVKENPEKEDSFGIKKRVAFLDMLLDLQGEGDDCLSDEDIREEVDTFMFAGHDTVSSATTHCLYELSKRPDIQERLVAESNGVLGDDKDVEITLKNINELKYLERVAKESLRYHATVPFIERNLESDVTIDGICIPKGTILQVQTYAMHRSEKYFPEPEKFDPDRFLVENCNSRHPFAYLPFSAGPRNCIGQKYAMLSLKCTVIKVVRNFEILPAYPAFEPILSNNAVLVSDNGICVQLKLRQ